MAIKKLDDYLREALRSSNESMRAIAAKAGVSNQSIHYFTTKERGISFKTANALIEVIMPEYTYAKMLNGPNEVSDYVSNQIKASQHIRVIGSEPVVLGAIQDAVAKGARYERIFTENNYVSDALSDHLRRVAISPETQIYQTPTQPTLSMVVSDQGSTILMASPAGIFGGLSFESDAHYKHLSSFFQSIIADDRTQVITENYQS